MSITREVRDGQGQLLALFVFNNPQSVPHVYEINQPPVEFFTSRELPLQLGKITRQQGWTISPHHHPESVRQVTQTCEVLVMLKGVMRVDLYGHYEVQSEVIRAGDAVLLVAGGHGFTMLEDCEMYEVKSGPYLGDKDKTFI